jgi:hypothetical protein
LLALPTFPGWLPYWPILGALLLVHLLLLARVAIRDRKWAGLVLSGMGATLAALGLATNLTMLMWAAAGMAAGSAVAVFRARRIESTAAACQHCAST